MAASLEGFSSFSSYFSKPLTVTQALGLKKLLDEINARVPLLVTYNLDSILSHINAIGLGAHSQYDFEELIPYIDAEIPTVTGDDLTDPLMIFERLLRARAISNVQDQLTLVPNTPYDSSETIAKRILMPKLHYIGIDGININESIAALTALDFFDISMAGDLLMDVTFVLPSGYTDTTTLLNFTVGIDELELRVDCTSNVVTLYALESSVPVDTAFVNTTVFRQAPGIHTPLTARIMKVGSDVSLSVFSKMNEELTTVDTVSLTSTIDFTDPSLQATTAPFFISQHITSVPTAPDLISLTIYEGY